MNFKARVTERIAKNKARFAPGFSFQLCPINAGAPRHEAHSDELETQGEIAVPDVIVPAVSPRVGVMERVCLPAQSETGRSQAVALDWVLPDEPPALVATPAWLAVVPESA